MVFAIGWVDYVTGYKVSLFVFYAIPIMLVVWYGERSVAIFIALLSALVWWWADFKSGHPYLTNWEQVWEAAVRLTFFIFVVIGGSAMKNQRDAIRVRVQALERTRQLEKDLVRAGEREQQRIGQDLHDGLCQELAAIGCAAASLREDLEAKSPADAEAAHEIQDLLKDAVVQARSLARGIFPVQMDGAGLSAALEDLTSSTSRLMQASVTFECTEDITISDPARATHLYRIAQEALSNALKHGQARHVKITLSGTGEKPCVTVTDDGTGFLAVQPNGSGIGLKTMGYRARQVGGLLETGNNRQGGAFVKCEAGMVDVAEEEE